MSKIAMVITTPPHSYLSVTAICLLEEMLKQHQVVGVFFYQDGALFANKSIDIASDEFQAQKLLLQLTNQHNVPLHLCITAAEKRGLTDDELSCNIDNRFTISGLGELVELSNIADKVVQL